MIYMIFLDYGQQNIFKKHASPFMQKTGKSKGYTFLNVPDHVYSEKVKLNGVESKSKQLVLEEAKTKHKDRTLDKQNSPNHQSKNYYLNIGTPLSSTATPTKRTTMPATTTISTATQTI